jgi:FtsP/CotA-like multicopper oxidase with cupredoxin domain
MKRLVILLGAIAVRAALGPLAFGQSAGGRPALNSPTETCSRAAEGSTVEDQQDLHSENGVLRVELAFRSYREASGSMRYCYVAKDGSQSPTLRLHPGDTVILLLKNEASVSSQPANTATHARMDGNGEQSGASRMHAAHDPCAGASMISTATNLHFHGLEIPPLCHQDEVVKTSITPTDAPFEYRFQVPFDTPPGLYWYHPHLHGFSKVQVLGGASGALIVEGVEREAPFVAGLPERVLIVRDQDLVHPDAKPVKTDSMPPPIELRDAEGDILNTGTGTGKPAKDLSINFVAVPFPEYSPAVLKIKPAAKEFWRLLNASAITYLDLQVLFDGKPQMLGVVSLDGVPIHEAGNEPRDVVWRSHLAVPPAGRVEFIFNGPTAGTRASLVTRSVDTGPAGENDPTRPLATILATTEASETRSRLPILPPPTAVAGNSASLVASLGGSYGTRSAGGKNPHWVGNFPAVHERKLYFSEEPEDPTNPNSPTKFYITVEGQKPKQFDLSDPEPNIVVQQGDVEEWTIENRTRELHAFHIHQIHFQLLEWNGVPLDEPFLRDTINVAYWDGYSAQYPSVKLKMDFRDPRIVGTFVYHCHLLEHEDGGMMGTVRVEPQPKH